MKYKMEWKYKTKGKEKVLFTSDFLSGEIALEAGEELENSGKASDIYFYDELGTGWTLKEMKRLLTEIEEDPHDLVVFFDGGYHKDSNKAGLGAVIFFRQGKKKFRIRANEVIDEMDSNNEAEYAAIYFAVSILEEMGVRHMPCDFKGDSQGVIKQLDGEWPCYEEQLNRWLDRIEQKLKELGIEPRYEALSRNENKEADKLASQALEGKPIYSRTQLL